MITDVEDYFTKGCDRCKRFATPDCSVQLWSAGLADLRRICLGLGLTEVVKWGHPCYMHAGRNIAIFGAFRDNFRLSFMNGSLLKDTDRALEKLGPNTENATILVFRTNEAVADREPLICAYLTELMGYAEIGLKPAPKHEAKLDLAEEFIDSLDADPELSEAFSVLTPGRKRSWNLYVTSAKQPATRLRRIEKARDQIIAGKGWNER